MTCGCVAILAVFFSAEAPDLETLEGKVKVAGSRYRPVISIAVDGASTPLKGTVVAEISRLHAMRIEVTGRREQDQFVVHRYRILDIGRGATPLVGYLQRDGGQLMLKDGRGDAIPLTVSARSRRRLSEHHGAKLWVFGQYLLSGEYKIKRFGILREAVQVRPPEPEPEPKPAQNAQP